VSSVLWADLKAAELRSLAERDAIVVVPVASMEQHGPHLPVQVDTMLCMEVCRRAAIKVSSTDAAVVAPPVWTGLSEHHVSFGGTFTLDFETFFGLLRCITDSLTRQGFRRLALINGHGGNIAALEVVAGQLATRYRVPIITATYWRLATHEFSQILEQQTTVRHACEAETSMVMRLAPQLVDVDKLSIAHGRSEADPQDLLGAGVYRWISFASRTDTGVIGDAALANAEKGERLLEAAAQALSRVLLGTTAWSTPL
jgi:creatinine amidohydrolase